MEITKKWWFWVLVVILILAILRYIFIYVIFKKAIAALQKEVEATDSQIANAASSRTISQETTKLLAKRQILKDKLAGFMATYNSLTY